MISAPTDNGQLRPLSQLALICVRIVLAQFTEMMVILLNIYPDS